MNKRQKILGKYEIIDEYGTLGFQAKAGDKFYTIMTKPKTDNYTLGGIIP